MSAAKTYIRRFHPNIVSDIVFSDDNKITPELLRSPVFKLAEFVATIFAGKSRKHLRDMARHRKGDNRFGRYAALHPFIHEVVETNSDASALVSFGADSETAFYPLRRRLQPFLRLDGSRRTLPTIQYITTHHTPPYHMLSGGDISMNTALEHPDSIVDPDVHSPVRKSLDQLFSDVGGINIFYDFLKSL